MSSARTRPTKPGTTRLSLVGALAEEQRRKPAQWTASWRDPAALGRSLKLTWAATTAQVKRAEALGLIDRKAVEAGERVALTELGWKLFGCDDSRDNRASTAMALPKVDGRPPLVQLLVHWPAAIALVEELADHLGLDVEAFWDEVQAVEQAGEVETWPDHPAGPAVLLSAMTAERLGLSLSSDGTRWLRPHDADSTSIDSVRAVSGRRRVVLNEVDLQSEESDRGSKLARFVDPDALEGWEAVATIEAGEQALYDITERRSDPEGRKLLIFDREPTIQDVWDNCQARQIAVLPAPTLILGLGLMWPIERRDGEPCPGCHDGWLGVRTYCLVCSRSGLDDVIREMLSVRVSRAGSGGIGPMPQPRRGRGGVDRRISRRVWRGFDWLCVDGVDGPNNKLTQPRRQSDVPPPPAA